MTLRLALIVLALVAVAPAPARSQAPASSDITARVLVVDSTRAAIAGAEVSIVKGLHELVARRSTDDAGSATLSIARIPGDLHLVVRRIGFHASDEFFVLPKGPVITLDVVLHRAVQTLAPVSVTAAEDLKRKSYHLDADDVANSTRPLFNAMDIVTKLRPDMIYGRAGKDMDCGVKNVWVNGTRILNPPIDEVVMARVGRATPIPTPQLALKSSSSGRRQPMSPLAAVDPTVWLTLATIKPEHVAEMTYEDCHSTKVVGHTHSSQALFVVLKPGVGYDPGKGSYVIAEELPIASVRRPPANALPAYRARLLGVYDASTGDPLEHVTVTDSASGVSAQTTQTGTVSLLFLPEGTSTLHLTKAGFTELRLDVTISPRDTNPLTLLLTKPD